MNQTLKETLPKLCLETDGDLMTLLPLALFNVRNSLYVQSLSSFEIIYESPLPFSAECQFRDQTVILKRNARLSSKP